MGRGFQRHDFIGGGGPGLDKLRATNLEQPEAVKVLDKTASSLNALQAFMGNGQWEAAILLAAKWPVLGDEAAAIHRGREAILRAAFQRQLKRDPAQMIEEAKAALIRSYGK